MSSSVTELFPVPSLPPSTISPTVWAGVSPESTLALLEALKDNHEKWHVFHNDMAFHNHAAHHVIANWALGASSAVIKAAYKASSSYQRPAFKSPEPITAENFNEHLGDEKFYNAYLVFFTDAIRKKGVSAILEEYIFSTKANFDPTRETAQKKQPEMLNRFLSGLLHPLIHTGYGVEFGLPAMVIEGLAQAAVHEAQTTVLIPATVFESDKGTVSSHLDSLVLDDVTTEPPSTGTHAFSILARILKDPQFALKQTNPMIMFENAEKNHGEAVRKLAEEWTLDTSDPRAVAKKIEELQWANAIIYGIGGWKGGHDFRADFFHMHLVNSSIFLPSLVAYLKPAAQATLLRSYFTFSLIWWISNGRPGFNIAEFFATNSANPTPSGPLPTPWEGSLTGASPDAVTPNPWLPIVQTSIVHADEHLPKLQRTLAHYSVLYGSRIAGLSDFKGTELEGADKLDGSLFIRAAGLTAKRMGRVREGEKPAKFWDLEGFFAK